MARHGCLDGETLINSNYSSPVPVIGLYIAGATVVCFLFMFSDIWVGLYSKRWLPCKYFSLNSLTLTLLSVCAKLPVDLTTPMPGALDQFSKLTGTTIICIAMAFFMPSLGTMESSGCFSNMTALTIFVITVIVNIGIQISTGVIFSFVVEHIIIMFFMLVLLVTLWCSTFEVIKMKDYEANRIKKLFVYGRKGKSMMDRLKRCYLYSYSSDPQLLICRTPRLATMGMVSTLCAVVVSEAVLQSVPSVEVDFCRANSDYKWSMLIVVVSQIVTIMLGLFGILFRLVGLVQYIDKDNFRMSFWPKIRYMILYYRKNHNFVVLISKIIPTGISMIYGFLVFLFERLVISLVRILKCLRPVIESVERSIFDTSTWIENKGVEEMNRWMKTGSSSSGQLIQLLSKIDPSNQFDETFYDYISKNYGDDYRLSCLSLLILLGWTAEFLPDELRDSLASSVAEVFEIIVFIDEKMSVCNFVNKEKLEYARVIFNSQNFKNWNSLDGEVLTPACVYSEVKIIEKITGRDGHPLDPERVQQLFVDMLNSFLVKLPNAIFKDIVEGRSENYEERLKCHIKCIQKLELVENKIQWKFPAEIGIKRLITTEEVFEIENQDNTQAASSEAVDPVQLMEEGISIQEVLPNNLPSFCETQEGP